MSTKKDHQPANSILDKLIAKDAEVILISLSKRHFKRQHPSLTQPSSGTTFNTFSSLDAKD